MDSTVYIDSDGKLHKVSEMYDNHLLNAYVKNKKKIETLKRQDFPHKIYVINEQEKKVALLKAEIDKRKLI